MKEILRSLAGFIVSRANQFDKSRGQLIRENYPINLTSHAALSRREVLFIEGDGKKATEENNARAFRSIYHYAKHHCPAMTSGR